MLPSDVVRVTSAVLFVLIVVSMVTFFPREARRGPRTVRSSRPLSFATGPLWEAILLIIVLSLLVEALLPDWVYDGSLTLRFSFDSAVQEFGLALWMAGGLVSIWAMRTLGRFTRSEIEVRSDHRLVAEGPYRTIRHPLYVALLMIGAGVALFLLNALLMVLVVIQYEIARRRALVEEELLASEDGLGAAYRRYMDGTGRFLPRLRPKGRRRE